MGFFDSESAEQKLAKAMANFEVHTTDITVNRKISKSKFVQHVGLNSYDVLRELINYCKEKGYNGIIGYNIAPSGGIGGAQASIIYGMAVKFTTQ